MFRLKFSLLASLFLFMVACVDKDFDTPPAGGDDPNLPVNTTIAEIKARHNLDQYEQITDEVILGAVVISNDEAGNFFKQLVIQDASGGIEMRVDISDLHNLYPVGRKVYVKAKGLWIGDYNGLIQLGAGVGTTPSGDPELLRIPEAIFNTVVIPATFGNTVVPKLVTIGSLTLDDVSTLVQFDEVQFASADAGVAYADPILMQTLNRDIEDCSHQTLIMRNSGFASFAGDLTPTGKGTLVGVLGVYRDDFQFMIRDLNDVNMTGDRCGGGGGGNPLTVDQVRQLFSSGTTVAPAATIQGVVISDYTSSSVTGRNLYLQDATGGIVVRFAANHSFVLGDEIKVNIGGAALSEFNGLLQLDGVANAGGTKVAHPGDVTPREATVLEVLNNAQAWESTLVKIKDVTLSSDTSSIYRGSVMVTDATGSMILFTRSASTFSGQAFPTGTVTITAIVSEFNSPQIIIRNTSDVSGGIVIGGEIDESFDAIANDADVVLNGWANIAVKGTRLWRGKVFQGNHYAQATAYTDPAPEMEAWLITPPIVLDVPKKMTFESAKANFAQQGLSIWISSDFNGTDVGSAHWTELTPTLATGASPDNTFIPSGDINLSGFTGPVRVGFKYVGSGPSAQTSSFRIDNVKVQNL